MCAARPDLASRLGAPTWRPDLSARLCGPFQRVPTWRPVSARPELGGVQRVPNELFIKVQSGGSRGCVIVHTGGTPPVPPQNRGNSSASRLGENPNRVYPEGPGKLGTPKSGVLGVQIGANLCKFVQICANVDKLGKCGGPQKPGKRGVFGGVGGYPQKDGFFGFFGFLGILVFLVVFDGEIL